MSDDGCDHITGPLGKSRCCDCNGKRARCTRCVCAKAKRPCSNCHLINRDSCHNPHLLTVSQSLPQLGSQVSLQQLNFHPQLPISTLQLSATLSVADPGGGGGGGGGSKGSKDPPLGPTSYE